MVPEIRCSEVLTSKVVCLLFYNALVDFSPISECSEHTNS